MHTGAMSGPVPRVGRGLANARGMSPPEYEPGAPLWNRRFLWPGWTIIYAMMCGLLVFALWRADYPTWRTAAAAFLLLGNVVRNLCFGHMQQPVRQAPGKCPKRGTNVWLAGLASQFAIAGLTGGLHSPFLIATMAPLSGIILAFGWSRESKIAMRIVFLGVLLIIFLPARFLGPPIAEPWFSQIIALTLFLVAVLHSVYLFALIRALSASRSQFDRARDRMAQEALARARALEQLSAQLSHELKNPLGAIKALVQLSKLHACDDQSRERLQVAESEVERMNTILQEYLSFSRPLDKLRREPLALGALADEVLELLGAKAATAGVTLRRAGEAA